MADSAIPSPIPRAEWVWAGHAGHFIAAERCQFRMTTRVGNVLVSTVGEYLPPGATEPQDIGWRRLYETMAFRAHPTNSLPCGCPETTAWRELTMRGYQNAADATAGHMAVCEAAARGEFAADPEDG